MFRRKSPAKILSSIIHRVKLAEMKLRVAENIRRESRRRPINELVVTSAVAGIPVFPEFLARIYVNAAVTDFNKARKELLRFKKEYVDKMKYSVSMVLIRDKIDEAVSTLNEIMSINLASIDEVESRVKKCTSLLQEAINVLDKYSS